MIRTYMNFPKSREKKYRTVNYNLKKVRVFPMKKYLMKLGNA